MIAAGGNLAKLAPETLARLDEALPPCWSHGNPVDVLGDARSKRLAKAVEIVLQDPGADAVLVIVTPQAMTNPLAMAHALAQLKDLSAKPVLAAWLGGESMRAGRSALSEAGIANYRTPEQAVRAFMTLVAYARNLDSLYETPRDIPRGLHSGPPGTARRVEGSRRRPQARAQRKRVQIAAGGLRHPDRPAAGGGNGRRRPRPWPGKIGFPVVLKVLSPDITHKSDVGGVVLDLQDEDMVRGPLPGSWSGRGKKCRPRAWKGSASSPWSAAPTGWN